MPSRKSSIEAGSAFVRLFTKDIELTRGLKRAMQQVKRFGAGVAKLGVKLAGLGVGLAAGLAAAAVQFAKAGDEIAKMSKRTGVSTEALSELKFVASQTGTNFSQLENAFRRMQRSIVDGERGLTTTLDALEALGLTLEDLQGLSPEQQFSKFADALSQVEDPTRKAGLAMMIFGRSGTNLLPMFQKGSKGMMTLRKAAQELGLTVSTETAESAEELLDSFDALFKVVGRTAFQIGATLAPALIQMGKNLTGVAADVLALVKENEGLIQSFIKVPASADVMMAQIKLSFIKGLNVVERELLIFEEAAVSVWQNLSFDISKIWINLMGTMNLAFSALLAELRLGASKIVGFFEPAIGFIAAKLEGVNADELIKELTKMRLKEQADIKTERSEDIGGIEAERKGALKGLEERRQRENQARLDKFNKALQLSENELQDARKNLDKAQKAAAERRKEEESAPGIPKLPGELEAAARRTREAGSQTAMGSFNVAALASLQAVTGHDKQMLNAALRTADATEEMAEEGLAFT